MSLNWSRRKRADAFWTYWKDVASSMEAGREPLDSAYDKGTELLHKYDDALGLEIVDGLSGKPGLMITAYGNPDHRQAVRDLLAAKPELQSLVVTGFRPSHHEEFELEIEGYPFKSDQIWFDPLRDEDDPDFLGLDVYFVRNHPASDDVLLTAAGIAVQTLIGEEAFMDKIGLLRLGDRQANPEEFVPLMMLTRLVVS